MFRISGVGLTIGSLAAVLALSAGPTPPVMAAISDYQYLCPVPGSRMLRAQNGVVIRYGPALDSTTVQSGRVRVSGRLSGNRSGTLALSDDGATLVFTPFSPYVPGDSVDVLLKSGIRTTAGVALPALEFHFYVSSQAAPPSPARAWGMAAEFPPRVGAARAAPVRVDSAADCPEPDGYLPVTVVHADDSDSGAVFLGPFSADDGFGVAGTLAIVDDEARPLYWRRLPGENGNDFKRLADGRLAFIGASHAYLMDSSYAFVDSFATGNGYPLDGHDFQVLPNGHTLLMAGDPQPVRMDGVVPGGDPNATVIGFVLQELDLAHRVVFQWRSWDWIPITDCNSPAVDLRASSVDYVHANSVELDHDGNLLVSSRHLSEITKIDHATGAVIWRMGPHAAANQFAFPNDARGFSHQHDARRQTNGDLTLLDNGNFIDPQYSRGVEYRIDEGAKTATEVWEYETPDHVFGGFMGNLQCREDAERLLCWSGVYGQPLRLTELHDDGSLGLELGLDPNVFTYRAYRFPWRNTLIWTDPELSFGFVLPAVPTTRPLVVSNRAARGVTIDCAPSTHPAFSLVTPLPITLAPGARETLEVAFTPPSSGTYRGRIYLRADGPDEIVATPVDVVGATADVIAAEGGVPTEIALRPVRPNPARAAAAFTFDLPRAERVTLEVYGVDGRRVATVVAGELQPGRHEVRWRAHDLPGGVYFARLATERARATRRFVLVP